VSSSICTPFQARDGFFELDASKISAQTGLSRKTVYKSIAIVAESAAAFLA
jgi:hypothetical protein